MPSESFLKVAARRDVVVRAGKTALLVGGVLIAINQGDAILAGDFANLSYLKMALTMLVPYGVSTYSSVSAIRSFSD